MDSNQRIARAAAERIHKRIASDMNYDSFITSWMESEVLAAIAEAQAWRPIDSAPKDGTEVLLLVEATDGIDHRPTAKIGHWFDAHSNDGWWVANCLLIRPSHWIPLPPAPGATQ